MHPYFTNPRGPHGPYKTEPIEQRFWRHVKKTPHCWLWTSTVKSNGYGLFSNRLKRIHAHRFSWEINRGPIPKGKEVMHNCHPFSDNKLCVNPDHLRLGTHAQNMKDMSDKFQQRHGEESHFSKLTEAEILKVRKLHKQGVFQRVIGERFKISQSNVSMILSKKTWKHIH